MIKRTTFGFLALLALAYSVGVLAAGIAFADEGGITEISQLFASHGFKNNVVKPPGGLLHHEYLVPSGPYFQLFDWDMYFMGVALSYDGISGPLVGSVEDFLDNIDMSWNNEGYVPRIITADAYVGEPEMCKPFLAQAALRASETSGDYQWIKPYYSALKASIGFWENYRRAPDGLFLWYNGMESGVDNGPAISDDGTTEGVDLQVYIYREYQALSVIARELGHPDEELDFKGRASTLASLIQDRMWSEDDGIYYNIDSKTGLEIPIKTWVSFLPLWASIPTAAQADRMIHDHLLNPREFWSANGIRTLSADEAFYDPNDGYWQGPIWLVSNYLVMHGLMNYGFQTEAQTLAEESVNLLVADIKKSGGMNECYNPESGAPTAGGDFVSWDLLGEDILDEALSGNDPTSLRWQTKI
jgi:hypothetical protein